MNTTYPYTHLHTFWTLLISLQSEVFYKELDSEVSISQSALGQVQTSKIRIVNNTSINFMKVSVSPTKVT